MFERHQTKIAIFGGKPGEKIEFKGNYLSSVRNTIYGYSQTVSTLGMAGNQVLEWADLDSEIKTAEVKNVSSFTPIFRVLNWLLITLRIPWHLPICKPCLDVIQFTCAN